VAGTSSTVRASGLRELNASLGKLDKKLQREFQKEIRTTIAEPVARKIRSKAQAEGWGAATVAGIKAGTRHGGAVVTQKHRKTTGKRPDFGGLQQTRAFEPGLDEEQAATIRRFEDFLDRVTSESGLGTGGIL